MDFTVLFKTQPKFVKLINNSVKKKKEPNQIDLSSIFKMACK